MRNSNIYRVTEIERSLFNICIISEETHKSKNLRAKNEEYWALKQVILSVTTVLERFSG